VEAVDVAEVLGRLDAAGIWYCVEGGWGVDALLGEQTRPHDDVDLAVWMDDVERVCAALAEFGRDDSEWPSSFVLVDARGRKVDAHPLEPDENGDGLQAKQGGGSYRWPREHLDARGRIGGREVPCISPELQLRWHEYEGFDDVDWADMTALAQRFKLPSPGERPGFVAEKRKSQSRDDPV
jgi:lincosamide nucleotidyltransferase A/C/D/E